MAEEVGVMEETVQIRDVNSQEHWYVGMDCLPVAGHTLVIASAPKGVHHKVLDVVHHVGLGEHRVELLVRRKTAND